MATGPDETTGRAVVGLDSGRLFREHDDEVVGDRNGLDACVIVRWLPPAVRAIRLDGRDAVLAARHVAIADDHAVPIQPCREHVSAANLDGLHDLATREVDHGHRAGVVGGRVAEPGVDGNARRALGVHPPRLRTVGDIDRSELAIAPGDHESVDDGNRGCRRKSSDGGPPLLASRERDRAEHPVLGHDVVRAVMRRACRKDAGRQLPREHVCVRSSVDPDEVTASGGDDHGATHHERLGFGNVREHALPQHLRASRRARARRDAGPGVPALVRRHVQVEGRPADGGRGGLRRRSGV